MSDGELPDPPDVAPLNNPRMMTASELQSNLVRLFNWLQEVEASVDQHFDHAVVQKVRDAANRLLVERRDRHSDESAPRGG